jgi:polysaccharide transporter, PST family
MNTKKRLISNFLSLSSVQVANYILPLITVPYLVRVLGPEKYGLIAFSQAFIAYFALLTDYGFNLSATRTISINRDNKDKLSEIFCSVLLIKMGFMLISFLILCSLVFSLSKFRAEWLLYLLTFSMILGNVLFPVWFFQGMEKMKQIASLNIIAKIIFTASVFIFIKSRSDYIYLPLINSLGFILAGLISLWIVINKIKIKIKIPLFQEIKYQLKEGWYVFVSNIAMSLYGTSNTFILGIFTSNTIVGYYSAGEKIMRAVQGLMGPLSQTIYPHISKLASESRQAALEFIRSVVKLVGAATLSISLMLFIFAHQISDIVFGIQFKESIMVIQILAFLPFIIGLSNIFGIQVMLNFGLKQVFTRILIAASFINILMALILVVPFQHIGISISVLITEIFVTITMFFVLKREGIEVVQFATTPGMVK